MSTERKGAPATSGMVAVGRIAKSVGIQGELNIIPLTDNPDRFVSLKTIWVGPDEASVDRHTIAAVRRVRGGVVVKLREIGSRLAADARRGHLLFVEEKDAAQPKTGSYFIHDVLGMEVMSEEDEILGVIQDVLQLPANDVWVVRQQKKEILIPAIKEIVRSVDTKRRTVVIHAMEGLID